MFLEGDYFNMSKKKIQMVYFTKDIVDLVAERTGYSKKICHDTLMSFTGVVGDIIGEIGRASCRERV